MNRCPWGLINDLEIEHHDKEWEFRAMLIKRSLNFS